MVNVLSLMFEALVVSLGRYRLLKSEDSGRMFPQKLSSRHLTSGSSWKTAPTG